MGHSFANLFAVSPMIISKSSPPEQYSQALHIDTTFFETLLQSEGHSVCNQPCLGSGPPCHHTSSRSNRVPELSKPGWEGDGRPLVNYWTQILSPIGVQGAILCICELRKNFSTNRFRLRSRNCDCRDDKDLEKVGIGMSRDNQVIALIYSFAVAGACMGAGLLFVGP